MQSITFAEMRYVMSFCMEMACLEIQAGHLTGLNCQIFTNPGAVACLESRGSRVRTVGSRRDREGGCFESCVWRAVSSHLPQEVVLAKFSLYVHNGDLKPFWFYQFVAAPAAVIILFSNISYFTEPSCYWLICLMTFWSPYK